MDPTEVERSQAYNTEHVGKLPDHRRGFWLLVAATPFRSRALPFDFRTYSSRTIEAEPNGSRDLEHRRLLWDLDPGKPIIADREFSYEEFVADLAETDRAFVIRLNTASGVRISYDRGKESGEVPLHVAKGEEEPLWVMSKRQKYLDRLIDWALIEYATGFVVGELLRDEHFRHDKSSSCAILDFPAVGGVMRMRCDCSHTGGAGSNIVDYPREALEQGNVVAARVGSG